MYTYAQTLVKMHISLFFNVHASSSWPSPCALRHPTGMPARAQSTKVAIVSKISCWKNDFAKESFRN